MAQAGRSQREAAVAVAVATEHRIASYRIASDRIASTGDATHRVQSVVDSWCTRDKLKVCRGCAPPRVFRSLWVVFERRALWASSDLVWQDGPLMDRAQGKVTGQTVGQDPEPLGQIELIGRTDLGISLSYDVPACVPACLHMIYLGTGQ